MITLLKLQLENELNAYERILNSPRKGIMHQILLAKSAKNIQIIKGKINETARQESPKHKYSHRSVYDVLKAMCGFGDHQNRRDHSLLSLSQKTILSS